MTVILGIESSCDETAAAIIMNGKLLANVVVEQEVHKKWGGVVPELASRAHQQNIVPVIDQTLALAGIKANDIDGVAFTRGPGLLGSLLVGASFAKAFALALGKPLLEVNHMQAHILSHFIEDSIKRYRPEFPFLCLTVSGGHTQLVRVDDFKTFSIIGQTIDDAAGETFDKTAKILGLPYPGGPLVDKLAKEGNSKAFKFPIAQIPGMDFSFSGLKTAILYFVRDELKKDSTFLEKQMANICASVQYTIVKTLLDRVEMAMKQTGINQIALAGGVSANTELRASIQELGKKNNWSVFIPPIEYCTDNAAMIAMNGYLKFLENNFVGQDIAPSARLQL